MDLTTHDDWLQRWEQGNIGFHRHDVHPALVEHWQPRGGSVLVPLCGKSVDLRWLADRGHQVVGVELAERAIRDFFAEQQLAFDRREGALPAFVARDLSLTIHHGDFFAMRGVCCDALYDRAALVALPPEARRAYADHVDSLLRQDAFRLVITLDYDASHVTGPPFSVPPDEVRERWPGLQQVSRRDEGDDAPPKFRDAGVTIFETVWRT